MAPQILGILILVAIICAAVAFYVLTGKSFSVDQPALAFRRISLFKNLSPESLAKLEKVTEVFNLNAGQNIFTEGEVGDSLFIVAKGQLNVTKEIEGKTQVLKVMKPGDILGEMGLLTGQPRSANAVAKTELSLFKIGRIVFDEITHNDPAIRNTIWLTYSWHTFDNYQRRQNVPKSMRKGNRKKWFARHFSSSTSMGQSLKVPEGAAYAFVLTGSAKVGSSIYNAPSMVSLTNVAEVYAAKSIRIMWFPTL